MSIEHHPPDATLAAFAAGTLDHGQHVAIATHLVSCQHCRAFVRTLEAVGGAVIDGLPPSPVADGALAAVEARLQALMPPLVAPAAPAVPANEIPRLPGFLRRYRFGGWKWVAPAVHVRPIILPHESDSRVFLLRSGPGTKMLQHTHTGVEMTCVLSGAFRQGGDRFGPGDFDLGDDEIHHQPLVEQGEDCLCLVAMNGKLQLEGLLGRMMQPFIRL
jgi:putative transcriptional regulator